MLKEHFEELQPELVLLIAPYLPVAALNVLVLTCRRLREILQAELESRITPELAKDLLLWASDSKPHIVKKMLAPRIRCTQAQKNTEIALLLLEAGANPAAEWDQMEYQPLHLAVGNKDLKMMRITAPLVSRRQTLQQFARAFTKREKVALRFQSKCADHEFDSRRTTFSKVFAPGNLTNILSLSFLQWGVFLGSADSASLGWTVHRPNNPDVPT
ncbi:hypothetical protein B0H16DRAFT_1459625 [Mycena metata]|uniref:Ankyrin repeat protein n=1 Tax=Mycena metata TaxID=1033252 RepID=A0AAD7J156_9AGAR|nr:hypothetical protein B0H16DRAFT_1459625 [Mycena metata]